MNPLHLIPFVLAAFSTASVADWRSVLSPLSETDLIAAGERVSKSAGEWEALLLWMLKVRNNGKDENMEMEKLRSFKSRELSEIITLVNFRRYHFDNADLALFRSYYRSVRSIWAAAAKLVVIQDSPQTVKEALETGIAVLSEVEKPVKLADQASSTAFATIIDKTLIQTIAELRWLAGKRTSVIHLAGGLEAIDRTCTEYERTTGDRALNIAMLENGLQRIVRSREDLGPLVVELRQRIADLK